MIITCASCLTKYRLDDSRIPEKGAKVRCSRCKHVFYVVPPPETKEEILEDLESFEKFHEGLMEPEKKENAVLRDWRKKRGLWKRESLLFLKRFHQRKRKFLRSLKKKRG